VRIWPSRVIKEFEMKSLLTRFVQETDGQDLIEYALLAATIAIALTAAMGVVKTALNAEFGTIATAVTAGS
jgi:Flp pilus assembly pilin Flp